VIDRRSLVLAAAFIAAAPPAARALQPSRDLSGCTVDTWRSRDGLPGAWVRAIVQSPDGYLWVGTQGGLARYGGGKFLSLPLDRAFEEASDVMGLHAARDGTVWILPARGAPVCVRERGFSACATGERLGASVRVVDATEDRAGVLWLATTDGIYRVRDRHLEKVHPPSAFAGAAPTALALDRDGRLWVGTTAGLLLSERGGPLRAPAAWSAPTPVGSIFVTPAGTVVIAAEGAILHADGASLVVTAEPALRRPTQVIEDRAGNVWVATRYGLLRMQVGRATITFTRADGLPDDDVASVFEDREESLWVGTRGGGLAQFTDRTLDGQAGPPSLRDQWISTVAEDPSGALWVGTAHGLTRWKDGQERTFRRADGLPSDQVLSVQPAPDGTIWVGTDSGLARWRDGRLDVPVSIKTAVASMHLDPDGTLWLGAEDGVARVAHEQLQMIPVEDSLRGTSLAEIRGIQRDDRGALWISGGGRLYRLEGGRLLRPDPSDGNAPGKVRSFHRDRAGTLWLGTRDGLVRRRDGVWRNFGAEEGLTGADLFQITEDDRGSLWLGTSHGLLRVTRSSIDELERGQRPRLEVVSFDVSDQGREIGATRTRQPGVWKGRDGRLWFATSRGVVMVDPARVRVNSVPPPVLIEEAYVDGRRAVRDAANQFPPGSGAMEFHFAAITLVDPQKAQHRYLLEGFDRAWVEADTRRVAYYTNVKPGTYRFRVQGSNADGAWNEVGDMLTLTLAPHFHQTVWFYALVATGVLGLALAFHRMRLAQLRGRYTATLAERTRVARELHDSLLQGMAAALMGLRGLRKLFGKSATRPADEAVASEILGIETIVANNLEETRKLLMDLRDQPHGPVDLGAGLEQLARKLAGATGVEVQASVAGAPAPLPPHVSRALLLIAQEAVTNALKHGAARTIITHLSYEDERVILRISDDGRGFDQAAAPGPDAGHFGLQGMRERAAALGTIAIESRPGGGTTVEVTIPRKDRHDV
jgi:signal transduction histidine kinase/ligand-binding sensor domain-containing protein